MRLYRQTVAVISLLICLACSAQTQAAGAPFLYDRNLKLELVADELAHPISMAFLEENDFLVLERENGTVKRIINGSELGRPLIDLNVSSAGGALGMALLKRDRPQHLTDMGFTYLRSKSEANVFIYFDESKIGDCLCAPDASKLYRYDLANNGTQLVNNVLFLSLPTGNTFPILHEGGPIKIGPDGNVYLMVGDARSIVELNGVDKNKAVNFEDGEDPDGRAGILRFNPDGESPAGGGLLGDDFPLNLYYAYGIRNSFGFTFDPLSGKIWDTENGPDYGDEINLVEPGFNSGWGVVMGFENVSSSPLFKGVDLPEKLVDFDGKGKYSSPEFVWQYPVAPTALTFLESEQFGEYQNDLLVADATGKIYHFELNQNRSELILHGNLADRIADAPREVDQEQVKFGNGFGVIADMQIGPDGYLYIVSESLGRIFRIIPDLR